MFNSAGRIQGEPGKKYKIVACVLQHDGGSNWRQIAGSHKSINVQSVAADASKIRVTFNFTARNIVSFVVAPDETFIASGYLPGADVTTTYADITLTRMARNVGGYISYNGASWAVGNGSQGVTSGSFDGGTGELTITHTSIPGVQVAAAVRDGVLIPHVVSLTDTTTVVKFTDYAGVVQTTASTDMKLYFTRSYPLEVLNPTTTNVSGANIWCLSIMEV